MDFPPVACVICQCEVNGSAISPCIEGHHQCQICSIRLNGVCGVCTTPIELPTSSMGADTFVRVIPDTEYLPSDVQDFWDPQPLPLSNSNKYYENIVVIEDTEIRSAATNQNYENIVIIEDTKIRGAATNQNYENIVVIEDTEIRGAEINQNYENIVVTENTEIREAATNKVFYNSNHAIKHPEIVSPSLMEILRSLHETKCSSNCETFDYCIRQILYQQFDYNQESYCLEGNNLNSISISEILQNIHKNSCNLQCDNIVYCLSSTLKHLISTQTVKAEEEVFHDSCQTLKKSSHKLTKLENIKQSEDVKNACSRLIDKESNVVRACFWNDLKSQHLKPQFEVVTTFPTSSKKSQKDFSLPFSFESSAITANIIRCPLIECNVTIEDRFLSKHILEKHKQLKMLQLEFNKHKLFFIDPSLLECNEICCIASYMIPNVFNSCDELQLEQQGLPILIMACRVKISNLQFQDVPEKFSVPKKQYIGADDEIINADVAETVYGIKKKFKNEPVKWASKDILIICPVALIPKQKALRTILTIFAPQKPNANISTSFCMRSVRDFKTIGNLVGTPDSICLTSVDIAAFTSNGQHAIHCQIMCKV